MMLDAEKLRAEVEEHRARMQSPLWSKDDGRRDDNWTNKLTQQAHPFAQPSDEAAPLEPAASPPPTAFESFFSERDDFSGPHPRQREPAPDVAAKEIVPRLDALDHALERLTATVSRRLLGGGDDPDWLATAAGHPRTYDAPDAERTGVCVRVLPSTYA